ELDAIGDEPLARRELLARAAGMHLGTVIDAMNHGPLRRCRRDAHIGRRHGADARDALDERQPQRVRAARRHEHEHECRLCHARPYSSAIAGSVAKPGTGARRAIAHLRWHIRCSWPRPWRIDMNTKLSPHTSWLFAFGSIAAV